MYGIIVTKKDVWLQFEPTFWHSLNPQYRLLFWGQIEYKLKVDVEVIVRDTSSMKRWNVSSCDWLNFMNLSVSLPWQLESLIILLCKSFVIFHPSTYLYSTPFKLHAQPTPPQQWTLIMFGEKQPMLLYCINKVFKTLQAMYSLLLTQLCVRFLCILRLTWQCGVPVPAHNQRFRNTVVWTSLISHKIFTGKHSKIAYKWCRDISRQHEPHAVHPTFWCLKFTNVSCTHDTNRIPKTTLVK
jgi:hypothetical protein